MPARFSPRRGQKTRTIPILPTISRCSRRACGPTGPCADGPVPFSRRRTILSGRAAMLADLRHFLAELTGGTKPQQTFAENDYRRAAAALLVHVATLDGDLTDPKRRKLHA